MFKRIIPVFLLSGKRLVKGTRFGEYVDVGDPVSQAMIYDAQGADEIFIVDIRASAEGRTIDPELINKIIKKCRLPISAGGGIKSVEDARKLFLNGADKVVVNSYALQNPLLINELSQEFGSQSVVVSIDVKIEPDSSYSVYAFSGKYRTDLNLFDYLRMVIDYGAGEIIITSIDREGTLSGFDLDLYFKVRKIVTTPLIASGGAGCYDHIVDLFELTDCDACGIGKMLFLRDYDIVRIKSYLKGRKISVREA